MGDNYWTRKRLGRRTFLRSAVAGTAGAGAWAAVGCGDDDDEKPSPTSAASGTAAATTAAATGTAAATTAAATGRPTDGSYYSAQGAFAGITMDMHRELYRGSIAMMGMAYNNLLTWDDVEKGTFKGDLVDKIEQPDNRTFTFTLKQGAKFHNKAPVNGRALTMDDIKWNIERQRTQKLGNGEQAKNFGRNGNLYGENVLEKVEYVDEKTVRFTLKKPDATWITTMCEEFNVIEAKENIEQIEGADTFGQLDPKYIIGTGPYVFDRYQPTKGAHAVRNPDYFKKKAGEPVAFYDEMFWTDFGADVNPRRIAFEQKQIDIASFPNDVADAIAGAQKDAKRLQVPNPNNNIELAYNYNHPNVKNPFFSEPRIRQAIFIATDRDLLAKQAFQGLARPNPGVNWPFTEWALPQTELAQASGYKTGAGRDADIKEARDLWKAAGADALDAKFLKYVIVDTYPDQTIREWFPAMMNKALGTDKFSIEVIPVSTLLNYNLTGQNAVGYLGGWDQWISPDPRGRFAQVYQKGSFINFWNYNTPEMEDIISKAFQEFDLKKAQDLLKQGQRLLLKDGGGGHIQMVGGVVQYLQWPYLKRVGPTFIGYERQMQVNSYIDQKDPTFSGRQKPS